MANFVKRSTSLSPVSVGVIDQTVISPVNCLGDDFVLLLIENLSAAETFTGYAWSSPDGVTQWNVEENDNFVSIAPTKTRRMLLPADRMYVRVLGAFAGNPDSVRVSVVLFRSAVRRA